MVRGRLVSLFSLRSRMRISTRLPTSGVSTVSSFRSNRRSVSAVSVHTTGGHDEKRLSDRLSRESSRQLEIDACSVVSRLCAFFFCANQTHSRVSARAKHGSLIMQNSAERFQRRALVITQIGARAVFIPG